MKPAVLPKRNFLRNSWPSLQGGRTHAPAAGPEPVEGASAFTLMELLVVLAIIGILAAVALPAMKGMQKSNVMVSATRQMIDDLARARATAIRERTTVHVVFVPPTVATMTPSPAQDKGGLIDRKQWTNLLSGPFTRYAIFADRTVGDQPGQPRQRYIGEWRQLPEGVTIAEWEFVDVGGAVWDNTPITDRPLKFDDIVFPTASGTKYRVPHVAFDATGALLVYNSSGVRVLEDEVISLARASVLVVRNEMTRELIDFNVRESPPNNSKDNFNRVRIDALTGRARAERPEIQ